MSWKLSTLAVALVGMFGSVFAMGEQNAPWQAANPPRLAPAIASADASPLAAAKPTDKELIEKQKTCPVTDQPLGSMGKPVKVVVKGRTVFLCCAGCKNRFFANPEKYLKKLDEQSQKK